MLGINLSLHLKSCLYTLLIKKEKKSGVGVKIKNVSYLHRERYRNVASNKYYTAVDCLLYTFTGLGLGLRHLLLK